ncbi:hypothetical protein CCACVL1_28616 [Corchorus capsularis]|uniref:Transmembrane protein n=1 Tax=Corchorus capsularis TaxID=210143 RepID=A0A1R3G5Z1_COCAP|nr:hypothetical protein CCACVL1_28616 [Corchorus capsularis]
MDWINSPIDKSLELDLENGVTISGEEDHRSPVSGVKKKAQEFLAMVKSSFAEGSDDRVTLSGDASNSGRVQSDNVQAVTRMNKEGQDSKGAKENKLSVREKRKSLSNKKPPKPPRAPRAPSLDAADMKLIREIAEIAKLKRARIERMKALKKMKAAKATSSNSNMFAMVFTIIFCLVIMFQGMSPRGTAASFQGSPVPAGAVEGGLISVQFSGNPSASISNRPQFSGNPSASISSRPDSGSPNLVEQVAGLDVQERLKRLSG